MFHSWRPQSHSFLWCIYLTHLHAQLVALYPWQTLSRVVTRATERALSVRFCVPFRGSGGIWVSSVNTFFKNTPTVVNSINHTGELLHSKYDTQKTTHGLTICWRISLLRGDPLARMTFLPASLFTIGRNMDQHWFLTPRGNVTRVIAYLQRSTHVTSQG